MSWLSVHIAWRYLVSRKKHNVINLITAISMVGIAVGTMALVVVLSVFNGLDQLVGSLYATFDPEIRITALHGKTLADDSDLLKRIEAHENVVGVSKVLEETVHLKHKGKETLVTLKGVDDAFIHRSGLDTMMVEGTSQLFVDSFPQAILGYGVSYNLMVYVESNMAPVRISAARRKGKYNPTNPNASFKVKTIHPGGVFSVNQDFDNKYCLVPLSFAQDLLEYPNELSALEIQLSEGSDLFAVRDELKGLIGSDFEVKTRLEQNEIIYKTAQSEKWITFLILAFILVLASLNMLGSMVMILLEKKQDIFTLKTLGFSQNQLSQTFQWLNIAMAMVGGLLGLGLGVLIVWLQQTFGLVELSGAVVEYFPVAIHWQDMIAIILLVLFIGWAGSWIPAKMAGAFYKRTRQSGS